ncbi:hypothetical protein EDB87DRAFT_1693690 [Lactarius vividus]|nr:hypothetical protein EDB87DRAFT_1693690 [Lactarius vividus]
MSPESPTATNPLLYTLHFIFTSLKILKEDLHPRGIRTPLGDPLWCYVQVGLTLQWKHYIKTKIATVAFTTRERWTNFQPYSLERRGSRNVPLIFLKEAHWREYWDDEGYFVDFAAAPTCYRPVEFNFDHLCWVDHCWDVVRPAGPNYRCNINVRDVPADQNSWGRIDRQTEESESELQTPEESESSQSPSPVPANTDEQSLVRQAESLCIQEPETINVLSPATNMATATYTTEQLAQMVQEEAQRIHEEAEAILLPINPHTGHRMTADNTAIARAIGPDQPDPPSGGGPLGGPPRGFGEGFPGGFPGGRPPGV